MKKGCLWIVGVFFGLILIGGIIGANSGSSNATSHREKSMTHISRVAQADPCEVANKAINQGWKYFNASSYQSAYDVATHALTVNESCGDDDAVVLNKGFLLSVKALSEYHLSQGDSKTDLNEAMTVLEECQTNPRFYGTHTGAECESQQQNDAQAQTQWDIDSYSN